MPKFTVLNTDDSIAEGNCFDMIAWHPGNHQLIISRYGVYESHAELLYDAAHPENFKYDSWVRGFIHTKTLYLEIYSKKFCAGTDISRDDIDLWNDGYNCFEALKRSGFISEYMTLEMFVG